MLSFVIIFLAVSEVEFPILEFIGFRVNNMTAMETVHLSHGPGPRLRRASLGVHREEEERHV